MLEAWETLTHPLGMLGYRSIKQGDTLIIADMHVGYAARFPLTISLLHDIESMHDRIRSAREKLGMPKRLILAGDILDDFGLKERRTRARLVRFISELRDEWDELILLAGNHDPMLKTTPFAHEIHDSYCLETDDGCLLILHGHALPPLSEGEKQRVRGIIMGHEHPALRVSDGLRSEKYAAYVSWDALRVPGFKQELPVLVLPAFHPDVEGSDIQQGFQSPLLTHARLEDAKIILIEDDRLYPL